MKLNLDCVRDILLDIEEISDGKRKICISESNYEQIFNKCRGYEYSVLCYHLLQCQNSGYFVKGNLTFDEEFAILDLSPKGHDVLAKIRDNNLWNKFKKFALKAVGVTLSKLPDILEQFLQSQNL